MGWSEVASLFNPSHCCDLPDAADLQNGEQGTVSLICPLLVENPQKQRLEALSFGRGLLSAAWDAPLRCCGSSNELG